MLKNIFRVMILGDHLRDHNGFKTTTIFVAMIVFFPRDGFATNLLQRVCERERKRGFAVLRDERRRERER